MEDNTSNTPSAAPKVVDKDKPNALDQSAMAENKPNQDKNADLELKLAQTASFAGTILSEDVDSSAMVRGVLTSAVGSEIEQWLSQYAFARVQLSLDDDFSLRNSQLDLLFPLQDEEESLSFLQASFHRTDDRNQMNIGLGYRWFTSSWMLGGNTFFDYDLSRGHARFGLGLEYSRDFLRIGVNRYIRLTNWKTSSVIDGYNERPASGWDVRIKGWLPQLPQLGGRVMLEQYYGDEVAFTSVTERLKNPIAITAGVEYSPFPLLSFNLDNKHIMSSGNTVTNDVLFSVQLNYELGVPWATQIDPDTLAQARSLIHNRYELVERNNNIILEYQKQPVIVIRMAKTITGYPNESKPLMVVVKSKYGYDAADINIVPNGDFLKDGGRIDQTGETTYYAVLPTPTGTNEYMITGRVYDRNRNQSNEARTRVIVKDVRIDEGNTSFKANILNPEHIVADLPSIVANSQDTAVFELITKNSKGEFEDVDLNDISVTPTDNKVTYHASLSALTRMSAGVYHLVVTASRIPEIVNLTATVQGVKLSPAKLNITPGEPDGTKSTVVLSKDEILANNSDAVAVTATLKNQYGLPIANVDSFSIEALPVELTRAASFAKVSRSASATAGVTVDAIKDNHDGSYTTSIRAIASGEYDITGLYQNQAIAGLAQQKLTVKATADVSASTFAAVKDKINADGEDSVKLSLQFIDYNKQPVNVDDINKISIVVTDAAGKTMPLGAVTQESNGESLVVGAYSAAFKTTVSGKYSAAASYDGVKIGGVLSVDALPMLSIEKSVFSVDVNTINADGKDKATLMVTLNDYNSAPIDGDMSKISIKYKRGSDTEWKAISGSISKMPGSTGKYIAEFTSIEDGTFTFGAWYDSQVLGEEQVVTATATLNVEKTTIEATTPINANNSDKSTITLAFKDYNGQPIQPLVNADKPLVITVTHSVTGVSSTLSPSQKQEGGKPVAGVYEAQFKTKKAGAYQATASYQNVPVATSSTANIIANAVPSPANSQLFADITSIDADDASYSTITFAFKDFDGKSISPAVDNSAESTKLIISVGKKDASGSVSQWESLSYEAKVNEAGAYDAKFKTKTEGTYVVKVTYSGVAYSTASKLEIIASRAVSHSNSTFAVSPTVINV